MAIGSLIQPHDALRVLRTAGIRLSDWGKKPAKSTEEFVSSLTYEQVELWLHKGKPTLHVNVAVPYVLCSVDGHIEYLYEAERIFDDVSMPARDFDGTLGETFENGETPADAFKRGLEEELKFTNSSLYKLQEMRTVQILGPRLSPDHYPHLEVYYYRYKCNCLVSPVLHKKKEYIEKRGSRTTIWRWKIV
jgi:hypothetical protein